jgi:hypothetical protein
VQAATDHADRPDDEHVARAASVDGTVGKTVRAWCAQRRPTASRRPW